jgi:pimeloyl-ACP methyl ester carboxylesterase
MKKILLLGAAWPLLVFSMLRAAGPTSVDTHKFTYVVVHGAWGGGWAFREVDRLLTADGHKVFRPTLTGQGEKVHLATSEINLTTHITDIANVILWENLHDVVLVGHSYGGAVITGVIDRLPDRIRDVIYLDAAILNNGESFNEAFGDDHLKQPDANGFYPPDRAAAAKPIPHDVPHPGKTMTEPIHLQNQEAAKKIPTTYVLYVPSGKTIEEARFYHFYQRAKERGWPTQILQSDHNAQWSHPKELVALLEKVPLSSRRD